jgi:peroxiredoxin
MTQTLPQNPAPTGKASPVLIVFLVFGLLGVVAAVLMSLNETSQTSAPIPTPLPVTLADTSLIDKPAPNFELTALDGNTRYRLSSYRGRVVFVNFRATWCVPCQSELPTFEQFQTEQGSNGAVVLAVNQAETAGQITGYLKEHNIGGFPILLDMNLDVNTLFDIKVLPTTYVIDPAGVVRYQHLGEMKPDDLAAYLDKLKT